MLIQNTPGLRRADIVINSFTSCVPNAPEKFSWAPEMSTSKIVSQPRMFLHQLKGTITFKQLQCFTNRHRRGQFNKQMDMVDSNVKLVDFTSMFNCNFANEPLTINFDSIKLEGVHCIFNFPHEVESILSEAMLSGFQIHFLSPKPARDKAHANFVLVQEPSISALNINHSEELNLEDGDSSQNLKVWVSSPWM